MEMLFLGSGTSYGVPMIGCDCGVCRSSDPRNNRTRASVLIRSADTTIVIDVATDFRQQILRHDIRRLDAILLTHSHADHILGMDDVRAFSTWQKGEVAVYGNAETLEFVRAAFPYAFERPPGVGRFDVPQLSLRRIDQTAQIADIAVQSVPIHHGPRMIFGYRIGGMAYLTDCSGVPESSIPLLQNLDTLVVGAIRHEPHPAHFTVAQALELIDRLNPRRAFLTHISHRLDHAATELSLPQRVRLAYDGMQIEI